MNANAPHQAIVLLQKGVQLQKAGRMDEARQAYGEALALAPGNPLALQLLGGIAMGKGDFEQARNHLSQALQADPDNAELNNNLGTALAELEINEEALSHFGHALAVEPGNLLARKNLAGLLKKMGRYEDAIEHYGLLIGHGPASSDLHFNLGVALEAAERLEEAEEHYVKALELDPEAAEPNYYLGNLRRRLDPLYDATAFYQRALAANPDYVEAHTNLGLVLRQAGRREEAEKHWRKAIALRPDNADAQMNLALVEFEQGNLTTGWKRYEWRFHTHNRDSPERHFRHAPWDGSPLKDKDIFLWGEQGLGDEILYASMIPDVLRQGGRVTIECTKRLVDLFTRSFPEAEIRPFPYVTAEYGKRHFDFQCPTPGLGRFLRPTVDSFPTLADDYAYLKVDPAKRAFWKERLDALGPGPKIGLHWNSTGAGVDSAHYYASIEDMAPVLTIPGVDFVSLVYADAEDGIREAREKYGVTIHTWDDLDYRDDIDGVAALACNLDMVVSCLTAASELSGALGVRTLCFIGETPHYLMMGTGDAIWFPNSTFFGKNKNDPWQPLFEDIRRVMVTELSLKG